jgi:hypothetical protein
MVNTKKKKKEVVRFRTQNNKWKTVDKEVHDRKLKHAPHSGRVTPLPRKESRKPTEHVKGPTREDHERHRKEQEERHKAPGYKPEIVAREKKKMNKQK